LIMSTERPPTVADAFGQVVWLLSQSPLHRDLKVRDVAEVFLPAIVARQFRIFRLGEGALASSDGSQTLDGIQAGIETTPLGVAVWATLSLEAEARLEAGDRLKPEDWTSGDRTWLVEMVVPFGTPDNPLQEAMVADLFVGPLAGREVRLHHVDAATGERRVVVIPGGEGAGASA
jgi:cytolysin-activating lysine-acyltransferase